MCLKVSRIFLQIANDHTNNIFFLQKVSCKRKLQISWLLFYHTFSDLIFLPEKPFKRSLAGRGVGRFLKIGTSGTEIHDWNRRFGIKNERKNDLWHYSV
jgi:hypothetical protein